jgi:hypothetical protein
MPHAPADRFTRVALILTGLMMCLPFIQPRHTEPFGFFYSEWVAFVLGLAAMTPMLAQLRGVDKLKIAPYLERVQKHLEQQKKIAPEGGARRAN